MIGQSKIGNQKSKITRRFRRMCWRGRIGSSDDMGSTLLTTGFRFSILDFGLDGLKRQNNDVPLEAILAEVAIEGQDMVDSMMVDQCKAGAIDKVKSLSSYRTKIDLAVCSIASLTRRTLMSVWSRGFMNSMAAR
jgi:hypothetical protein